MISFSLPPRRSLVLGVVALTASCGGDAPTGLGRHLGEPLSIRVVAGTSTSDTIGTRLQQALIVEVRDSTGAVAPRMIARFEALPPNDPKRADEAALVVSTVSANAYSNFSVDTTDLDGQAKVLIQLGTVAGTARLRVSVPELGLVDTIPFTVNPGAAFRIQLRTPDTTVRPSASYTLNASLVDRASNAVAGGPFRFSVTSGLAQVSSTGQVTVGSVIARVGIEVGWQNLAAVAFVTVLPSLRMVGVRTGGGQTIVLVNTDGSEEVGLAKSSDQSLSPHAVASSDKVVYYQGNPGSDAQVWITSPTLPPTPLASPANGFTSAAWPRLSPDGQWVYFVSQHWSNGRLAFSLWRIRPDGSGSDSLASGVGSGQTSNFAPAVSPDGSTAVIGDANSTMVINLDTKAVSNLPVGCRAARYSPDGSRLACVNAGVLGVMNADGTGYRQVATDFDEVMGVDWSPDGGWVASSGNSARLVNVIDGTTISLSTLGLNHRQVSFVR